MPFKKIFDTKKVCLFSLRWWKCSHHFLYYYSGPIKIKTILKYVHRNAGEFKGKLNFVHKYERGWWRFTWFLTPAHYFWFDRREKRKYLATYKQKGLYRIRSYEGYCSVMEYFLVVDDCKISVIFLYLLIVSWKCWLKMELIIDCKYLLVHFWNNL